MWPRDLISDVCSSDLSPVIEGAASIADLASDVQETIEKLGVDTYGVIGLSLGGAVAQYLAANDPKVTSAAFLCTAPKFGTPESWHERARTVRADRSEERRGGKVRGSR